MYEFVYFTRALNKQILPLYALNHDSKIILKAHLLTKQQHQNINGNTLQRVGSVNCVYLNLKKNTSVIFLLNLYTLKGYS